MSIWTNTHLQFSNIMLDGWVNSWNGFEVEIKKKSKLLRVENKYYEKGGSGVRGDHPENLIKLKIIMWYFFLSQNILRIFDIAE